MIQNIRTYLTRHFAQIVIWISIVSVIGIGSLTILFQSFFGKSLGRSFVVRVNGYEIDQREFRLKIAEEERRLSYLRQQFGAQAPLLLEAMGIKGRPEEQALKELIQEKLLLSCARDIGLQVSQEELNRHLQDPMFLIQAVGDVVFPYLVSEQGVVDYGRLLDYLRKQGISPQQFKDMAEEHIKRKTILAMADGALYVPQQEVKNRFIRDAVKRTVLVLSVPGSFFDKKVRDKGVKEEELKEFFNDYNTRSRVYWKPETRSGIAWILTPEHYDIKITEKDIQDYYMRHKKSFVSQEEKRDGSGKILQPLVYKDLESVRDLIKKKVLEDKFQRLFNVEAQALLVQEQQNPEAIRAFFERKKARKIDLNNILEKEARFGGPLFKLSAGGKKIFVEGGEGIVLELTRISPSTAMTFDEAKERVATDWYAEKARKEMDEALRAIKSKDVFGAKAKEFGGRVETIVLNPSQENEIKRLQERGLPIEKMLVITKLDDVIYDISSRQGYVIGLGELGSIDEAQFKEHILETRSQILKEERGIFEQAFIDSLSKNATIEHNKNTSKNIDW